MKESLLVLHPKPQSTESLAGYMLRLAETNGDQSPWRLCRLGRIEQHEIRTIGFKIEKLALVSNQAADDLEAIAFSSRSDRPRWARLLGNDVLPIDLNIKAPAFCPECVAEKGFVEAHCHLSLMIGCPLHGRLGTTQCPKCRMRLNWFRPGLLECMCGADLTKGIPTPLPAEAVGLLGVMRAKVLGLPIMTDNPTRLPQCALRAMDLHSLLTCIRILGKSQFIADGGRGDPDDLTLMSSASRVLAQWPENLFTLLRKIGEGSVLERKSGVGEQFEALRSALFKNRTIRPIGQMDFIKTAFVDFARNHWGRGTVHPSLSVPGTSALQGRYVTQAVFAKRLGVQPRALAELLRNGAISSRRLDCGSGHRIVIDSESMDIPIAKSRNILQCREAAKRLGISAQLLQALKRSKTFTSGAYLDRRPGFDGRDVEVFKAKLLAMANVSAAHSRGIDSRISLLKRLRSPHDPLSTKVAMVEAVMSGNLPIIEDQNGTLEGLMLDREHCNRFIVALANADWKDTMTIRQAAETLGISTDAVRGLIANGAISGTDTPVGIRLSRGSVTEFDQTYRSISAIARSAQTQSRWLIEECKALRVKLLVVQIRNSTTTQAFLLRKDIPRVNRGYRGRSGAARRPKVGDTDPPPAYRAEAEEGSPPMIKPVLIMAIP